MNNENISSEVAKTNGRPSTPSLEEATVPAPMRDKTTPPDAPQGMEALLQDVIVQAIEEKAQGAFEQAAHKILEPAATKAVERATTEVMGQVEKDLPAFRTAAREEARKMFHEVAQETASEVEEIVEASITESAQHLAERLQDAIEESQEQAVVMVASMKEGLRVEQQRTQQLIQTANTTRWKAAARTLLISIVGGLVALTIAGGVLLWTGALP